MRTRMPAWLLVALVAGSSPGLAQAPATGCTQQCLPRDLDVNGPETATEGAVKVILYAYGARPVHYLSTELPDPDIHGENVTRRTAPGQPLFVAQLGQPNLHTTSVPPAFTGGGAFIVENLSVGQEIVAYLYVSFDPLPYPGAGAAGAPRLELRSEIELGDAAAAETLASGSAQATGLVSGPVGPPVYEFRIPMRVAQAHWAPLGEHKHGEGPTYRWVVHIVAPPDAEVDGVISMPTDRVQVRTGAPFPTRLVLEATEPLLAANLSELESNGRRFIQLAMVSRFGVYDLDGRPNVTIEGPTELPSAAVYLIGVRRDLAHEYGYDGPLNATWRIDFDKYDATSGDYRITATFRNLQGTFERGANLTLSYTSESDAVDLPGPGLPFVLLLAALGLALVRRRL